MEINMFQSSRQASVKYHGLQNQGATCYLNSVLQVLFMTKDFRERVKSHRFSHAGTEHIDTDLRALFTNLEKSHTHTQSITEKLRICNVYEQRDAAEVFEKILRLTSDEASQIFHGELINWNICQGCQKKNESAAGFWHLPLPLVNNNNEYSVERGIKDFFHPSSITGDDQMYCVTCDRKCDALLGCEVKCHPEVLVLLLKRFEMIYDGNSVRKVKINCDVKIPDTLKMLEVGDHCYKLYAFVEHFGDLKYGHFYATIKLPDEGRWYIFDDLHIKESDYQHFQLDPTERSGSAYLLFYQRQKARPGIQETPQATVTNGTTYTHRTREEEEENNTIGPTKVACAFRMNSGAKDKLVSASSKRGTMPEENKHKMEHKHVEMNGVKGKMNKKYEPSQNQTNGVVTTMPEREDKSLLRQSIQQRYSSSSQASPVLYFEQTGSASGEPRQEYSAANRHVRRSNSFTPTQSCRPMHKNVSEYPRAGMRTVHSVKYDARDRGRYETERTRHAIPIDRHRDSHGQNLMYHSQGSQRRNIRSNTESNNDQREKESKRTRNYYDEGNVPGQSCRQALNSRPPENNPQPWTPQQYLERAKQKNMSGSKEKAVSGRSGSANNIHNEDYDKGRERNAADYKYESKKSTNYIHDKRSPHGKRQLDREIMPLEEKNNSALNNAQTREEWPTLVCEETVTGTNVHKKKKKKKTKLWRRLLCCFAFRKSSK